MIKMLLQYFTLAVIIGPFPSTIVNATTVDANPVMADFNWIQSQVNANAQPLSGGSVTPGTGGTGSTTGVGLLYSVPVAGVGGSPIRLRSRQPLSRLRWYSASHTYSRRKQRIQDR
jgi:hypothetical protein